MPQTPTRIVIVEDNPDDQALLLRQLNKAKLGSQVQIIADGKRAQDFFENESSNMLELIAVFLDLKPPNVGGLAVLETIKSQEHTKHLPVVVMTSSNLPEEITRCRSLGAAFIMKPLSYSKFMRAVANRFHASDN
jgi:CheY-like chemotaxis protein